jgi:hypothetical protein
MWFNTYLRALQAKSGAVRLYQFVDARSVNVTVELKRDLLDKFVGATIEFIPKEKFEEWKRKVKDSVK